LIRALSDSDNPDVHLEQKEQALEFLLKQKNINVNASCDNDNNTALHYATIDSQPNALAMLLKSDQYIDPKNPRNQIQINLQNNDGNTPLHIAVQNKNIKAVLSLLQHEADIMIKNNSGQTPQEMINAHRPTFTEEENELADDEINRLFKQAEAGNLRAYHAPN